MDEDIRNYMTDDELAKMMIEYPEEVEDILELLISQNRRYKILNIITCLRRRMVPEDEIEESTKDNDNNGNINDKIKEIIAFIYEKCGNELYTNADPTIWDKDEEEIIESYFEPFDSIEYEDYYGINKDDEEEEQEEEPFKIRNTDDLLENLFWCNLEDEDLVQEVYDKLLVKIAGIQSEILEKKEKIQQGLRLDFMVGGYGFKELDQAIIDLYDQIDDLEAKLAGLAEDIAYIESIIKLHNAKKEYNVEVLVAEDLTKMEEELGINKNEREMGEE